MRSETKNHHFLGAKSLCHTFYHGNCIFAKQKYMFIPPHELETRDKHMQRKNICLD